MFRASSRFASLICVSLLGAALGGSLRADDWPAWRGPQRDGICRETGLLQDWPKEGPKLLWTARGLGEGFSGPAIVGNILYTMGNRDGKEYVLALDVSHEGKQLWATAIGSVRHGGGGYPGPRATPSIDGDRLYTLGINGDLVCLNLSDGQMVWHHDLVGEFGGGDPHWGYSESPLVDGQRLLCTPGGSRNTMLALNKRTGARLWGAPVGDAAAYSSIIPFTAGMVPQYVTLTAKGVIGVRASDGKFLWRYDQPANATANIDTCVTFAQTVFAASAYGTGGGLAWVQKTAGGFNAKELYFTKKMQNHHGGLILLAGALYGANNNVLNCLDYRTGKVHWSDRGCGKCSLLYADKRLYCRDERGPISLVAAAPTACELHGRFSQPERSSREAWPHLVIAGGMLYVRDQDVLLCYDVRAK
jgi:outer membrane protein assembly factor BamB